MKTKKKVVFCNNCIGPDVKKVLSKIKIGQIVLLENLRFHKGETDNCSKFANQLAENCDVYINDAFSASHRKHQESLKEHLGNRMRNPRNLNDNLRKSQGKPQEI